MQESNIQVKKSHYNFLKYLDFARFSSYWYQLREVLELQPESVLEVGPGDGVFGNYLKHNTSIRYTSVDFASDVQPDVVADIRELPFKDGQFDIVCAFEVLEHLSFEESRIALLELKRVAKKHVIISLPHWGRSFSFIAQLPFFGTKKYTWKLPYVLFAINHVWNGEHYWEIGKKGYPVKRIINLITDAGLILKKRFVPCENTYHHFFILHK